MTAPLEQFPYFIALWLRRMDAIDVIRDDVDHTLYKHGHTKKEALHKAMSLLVRGESVLIFPEGHTELINALYRFHTGAARLSVATGCAIQSITLCDAHTVFSNTAKYSERTVTVVFGKHFTTEHMYGEVALFTEDECIREHVRGITKSLEQEVLSHLPLSSVSEQRTYGTDIGVFVDIDLTIYKSLSQVDFLLDLTRRGRISVSQTAYILILFMLEKMGLISHRRLVSKAIHFVSGWNKGALKHLVTKFFREIAVPKLEYGLFAILQDHLARGHHLIFVSEVMHPLAEAFVTFFDGDHAIDTSLKERGYQYTGNISFLCRGDKKREQVLLYIEEHNINASLSYAYGDSYTDIPFLKIVGNPMAVNPDRKLRHFAKANEIPVLERNA